MIRLILIALVVVLMALCGIAVGLFYFFGWKGLIAVPFVLLAFVWIGKKMAGLLFKKFALGLFGMKASALKGATMNVHSITPVAKPIEPTREIEEGEESEGKDDASANAPDSEKMNLPDPIEEEPKHYYNVDVTITPKAEGRFWEPSEFVLTTKKASSLEDLDDDVGSVYDIKVWDGAAFGPDDPGKYPGEQRLLITFTVKPGTRSAWVHYYTVPLGQLELPEWQAEAAAAV